MDVSVPFELIFEKLVVVSHSDRTFGKFSWIRIRSWSERQKKNEERNGIVYGIRIVRVKLAGVAIAEIPLIAGAPWYWSGSNCRIDAWFNELAPQTLWSDKGVCSFPLPHVLLISLNDAERRARSVSIVYSRTTINWEPHDNWLRNCHKILNAKSRLKAFKA